MTKKLEEVFDIMAADEEDLTPTEAWEDSKEIIEHINWRKSVLQLDESKKISNKFKIEISEPIILKIVKRSSEMAMKGIITEDIAVSLEDILDKKDFLSLQNQLNCIY